MSSRRGTRNGLTCDPHATLWAALTLIAFPIAAFSAGAVGFGPLASFLAGAAGSLLILLVELATCGHLWFFDPCIERWFGHPATPFRLLAVVGLILLLFQTFVLMGFIMSRGFDASVTRFILARQCQSPDGTWFARLCQTDEPRTGVAFDPIAAAMRETAAQKFFPGSKLVTCAARPIAQHRDERTVIRTAVVRCDQWTVGSIVKRPVSFQHAAAIVAASLHVEENGSYRVDQWSDVPSSDDWRNIAGPIAEETDNLLGAGVSLQVAAQADLAAETEDRIFVELERR